MTDLQRWQIPAPEYAVLSAAALLLCLLAAAPAAAQPKFGLEIEGGRTVGLTPYLRNSVYAESELLGEPFDETEPFRPYLGNARTGWGTNLELRLLARGIYGGISFRWFDVSEASVHHRGFRPNHDDPRLRPTRVRPDGSVDDAGTDYRELERPVSFRLQQADRANLWVLALNAGYRFYVFEGPVDIFIPVGGGLVLSHLTRPRQPFRPGLEARTGVGAAFEFASVLSLVVNARMHALATTEYQRRSDAARRAVATGGKSPSAYLSTMVYPTLNVGVRFTIR